jgi:hypothetical protein
MKSKASYDGPPQGENTNRMGVPLDKEKVKEQIIKYKGNLTKVAQAFKCSRQTITRIVRVNPDVKEILEEARERVIDDVEDAFTRKAINGDTTASIFFLKTRARERGYDQDFRADMESVTRAALDFALNKSRNPAESNTKIPPSDE